MLLSISKTTVGGIERAQPGDMFRFQVTVFNQGPELATGVQVMDLLPQGFAYDSYSATAGVYDVDTGLWDLVEPVPVGGSQTLFVEVKVNDPTDTLGEFVNYAEIISANELDPDSSAFEDATVDDLSDGEHDDDEDFFVVQVATADLSISSQVSNPNPNVGELVTMTIFIDNEGPNDASGVSITDQLPQGFINPTAVSDSGAVNGDAIEWTNLQVPVGGMELTYQVEVARPTSLNPDEYTNVTQIVASNEYDPTSTPDNDDGDQSEDDELSTITAIPTTDLSLTKQVSSESPSIGDHILFTVTASNLGDLDATNILISEVLQSGYQFISYQSTNGTYDYISGLWDLPLVSAQDNEQLTITVEVLDSGNYDNAVLLKEMDQLQFDGSGTADNHLENDLALLDQIEPLCGTVHNQFSPNGDGINEYFIIDCITSYPDNRLIIYNRWGNVVYEKKGYNNTFNGVSNGRATLYKEDRLPVGTYYYTVEFNDGVQSLKSGWLYINR